MADAVDVAIWVGIIIAVGLLAYGVMGSGTPRGESEYTGVVVDVVEDKGLAFRPSWVNMKTNSRSSDVQQYCLADEDSEMIDRFYSAMDSGQRVTVSYSRPFWVSPDQCKSGQSIIHDVQAVNGTINTTSGDASV